MKYLNRYFNLKYYSFYYINNLILFSILYILLNKSFKTIKSISKIFFYHIFTLIIARNSFNEI